MTLRVFRFYHFLQVLYECLFIERTVFNIMIYFGIRHIGSLTAHICRGDISITGRLQIAYLASNAVKYWVFHEMFGNHRICCNLPQNTFKITMKTCTVLISHTCPDSSDWQCRSHITQFHCGYRLEYLFGYYEGTLQLLHSW